MELPTLQLNWLDNYIFSCEGMLCFSIPFSFGLDAPGLGGGGTETLELMDWSAQVISTHDKDGVSF